MVTVADDNLIRQSSWRSSCLRGERPILFADRCSLIVEHSQEANRLYEGSSGSGSVIASWLNLGNPDVIPCFPAEILVHTPTGVKPIAELTVGEEVLSYDEKTGTVVPRKITVCLRNWTLMLVKLTVGDEIIWATRIHPFYLVDDKKWVPACDLRPGMQLLDKDLQPRLIDNAEHMGTHEDTYNITVDEFHTFFVGEAGLLVHNTAYSSTIKFPMIIYGVRNQVTQQIVYVGKTTQGIDVRFQQHINGAHPEWANGYTSEPLGKGNWTSYESSVWEQHHIDVNGGLNALENQRSAISETSYYQFKSQFNPC
jgi:hypothetical protein